jgi:hypothetical protein
MGAVCTPRDMTAECSGAAAHDCTHHLQLTKADVPRISRTPSGTMVAEDIRDLQ